MLSCGVVHLVLEKYSSFSFDKVKQHFVVLKTVFGSKGYFFILKHWGC